MHALGRSVLGQFPVARLTVYRPAEIGHDLGIGMQARESVPVAIVPAVKP